MRVTCLLICLFMPFAAGVANAQDAARSLDELLKNVREQGTRSDADNRRREEEFRARRDEQKAILDRTKAELRAEEARSAQLKDRFDANELELENLSETLRIRVGDMGELFGVVRQVAGDVKGMIDNSLTAAQFSDRGAVANRLAQAKGLPSITELRELQTLLLEEMIESGKVVRFTDDVEDASGLRKQEEVVRIGVFNAINATGFLSFDGTDGSLRELPRPPADRYVRLAEDYFNATSGNAPMAIDPSRGMLLSLVIQTPSLVEQINQGGTVGYAIITIGLFGLIIAIYRLIALNFAGRKINRQLKAETASLDNPLGRVLSVYDASKGVSLDALDLKLDEAILRETPKLERMQGTVKVLAGIAPLMGLLGTVVGMIRTFQTITLFGTGDPKLMAGGISQALVTTVLGLVVAIPLVFMHALISARSRALVDILEEQSAGIVARYADRGA